GCFNSTDFTLHWIFLINVPSGLIGIWLGTRFLARTEPMETPPLDFIGFVLSGLAASGVVFGLSVVSLPYLPPATGFITVAVGLLSGALYLMHAR
ncbi:MFS transporter, partial [Mesorhizobium sp. M00.F.Ca.ET.158.01.1.1]